ncbi:hypothetical protein NT6N_05220 [Oceaniferula spumae]|uniref:Protein kinase domain-containing protein n=1 Tax=Oceaniferula spumae TaxID=2979115 RepID=A0AAT9FHL8_9BACT
MPPPNQPKSDDQISPTEDGKGVNPAKMLQRVLKSLETQADNSDWEAPEIDSVNGYRVESLIGRGGMGAVYKVVHEDLQRVCALKLLPVSADSRPDFGERFMQEARAMARLHHPNIVHVYDFGRTDDGHLYYVMEYVEGADLSVLMKEGRVDSDHARDIVLQVCDALHYAHRMGFVHRDIKPGNIILDDQGCVKVADFGLAKMLRDETQSAPPDFTLTMQGEVLGTPGYMSPEQSCGDPVDHRTDIYALGVIYYQMLTGSLPLGHFNPPSAITKSDGQLDAVVMRLLSKNPEDRYQQAIDVRDAITVSSVRVDKKQSGKWMKLGLVAALVAVSALATAAFIRNSESPKGEGVAQQAEVVLPNASQPYSNSLEMSFLPVRGTSVLFSQWETRWDDWDQFIEETGYDWEGPTFNEPGGHPALNISWQDANAFCEWLTEKERAAGLIAPTMNYRLPTDWEWSCAVGLYSEQGDSPKQRSGQIKNDYPWGLEWPPPENMTMELDQSEAFDIVESICFAHGWLSGPMRPELQEKIVQVTHRLYQRPWREKVEKTSWDFVQIPQQLGNAMIMATDTAVVRYWKNKTVVLLGECMGHHAAALIGTIGWNVPDWSDQEFIDFVLQADWGQQNILKVWTCIHWDSAKQAYCLAGERYARQNFAKESSNFEGGQVAGILGNGKLEFLAAPVAKYYRPMFIFEGRLSHEDLVKVTEDAYAAYQEKWYKVTAKLYRDLMPEYENEWRRRSRAANLGVKNQFGIQGMAGGAKEWVADAYELGDSDYGTLRGGSIRLLARGPRLKDLEGDDQQVVDTIVKTAVPAKLELLSSYRQKEAKDSRKPWYGFRTVLAFEE